MSPATILFLTLVLGGLECVPCGHTFFTFGFAFFTGFQFPLFLNYTVAIGTVARETNVMSTSCRFKFECISI